MRHLSLFPFRYIVDGKTLVIVTTSVQTASLQAALRVWENAATGRPGAVMIDRLEFLIALASERHFSRAARACGVTQATLSAGLKQLEGMFGVMLVQRGARFVGFTDEGERALEWARRVVAAVRGMQQDMEAIKGGLSGRIRIAAIPTALAMVALLTTPFRARHPEVQFT